MHIVDSHCHLDRLDLSLYQNSLKKVLDEARERDIRHFLNISTSMENFPTVLEIANSADDIHCSCGVHPLESDGREPTVEQLVQHSQDKNVVAIGETGLDYFYIKDNNFEQRKKIQQQRFETHIEASNQAQLPLIIHTRDAKKDTIDMLKASHKNDNPGVMHCFTEDWDMAKKSLDLGFYISISGIVTFRNAENVREVAKKIPLDRLLIETDSPYLAPVPHRGKSNVPGYVHEVGHYLAELLGVDFDSFSQQTSNNFYRLFDIESAAG